MYALPHIVRPGETISSVSYAQKAGGKGANQAYALARAGAAVDLDAVVGQDGRWVSEELQAAGVGTVSVSVHRVEVSLKRISALTAAYRSSYHPSWSRRRKRDRSIGTVSITWKGY